VTFDPAIATTDRRLEFVSLHHPLIRAICESADMRDAWSACASVIVDLDLPTRDPHAFFVFELDARGMKDELELIPFLVSADGRVADIPAGQALTALGSARNDEAPSAENLTWVPSAYSRALARMAERRDAHEDELARRNDEIVSAQIDSLRLSKDRRRLWLREQIETSQSPSIVRMRKAQLERLDTDWAAREAKLERKREVSVAYRLVAAGLAVSSAGAEASSSSLLTAS
jgi:hypothetical protein